MKAHEIEMLRRFCGPREGGPAVLLAVAHPDDEVIGAGARIAALQRVAIVYLTDGSPREGGDARAAGAASATAYAQLRWNECEAALVLAGLHAGHARRLGFADQELSFQMAEAARVLMEVISGDRPDVVVTHPYEGGHPDHDAAAWAVHAAITMIEAEGGRAPVILEMTSYHAGPRGWETGKFLPGGGGESMRIELDEAERELKRRMMACHVSQCATLANFGCDAERFRVAPCYDFTAPPHKGPLLYEGYAWGMSGVRWRELAREAAGSLRIGAAT